MSSSLGRSPLMSDREQLDKGASLEGELRYREKENKTCVLEGENSRFVGSKLTVVETRKGSRKRAWVQGYTGTLTISYAIAQTTSTDD